MQDDSGVGKDVLNLAEAARLIRVSPKTLRAMARARRIPAQKAGREWRFLREALAEWLRGDTEGTRIAESSPTYRHEALFAHDSAPAIRRPEKYLGDTAFTKNRREPLHRWVPWIAGFSADFVDKVLSTQCASPARAINVLDPFAGVGTTLVEGLKRGYGAIGFEINPYAALACRAKLEARHCDVGRLSGAIEDFTEFMRKQRPLRNATPRAVPPGGFRTNARFFSPLVERQALFAVDFIEGLSDDVTRDLFKVAFGSVIVSFSNYSYEPSLSTRRAAGKSDVVDADVARTLADKLWEIAEDVAFFQRHMARFSYEPPATIHERSYLEPDPLPPGSVDILITSPPYLNNYHYIRNTRPQLYWLGIVSKPSDLKETELASFGQFWQTVRAGPEVRLTVSLPELRDVIELVRSQRPEKGVYGGRGWANYAATYFNDCSRFWQVTRDVMRPGGHVYVVIGNSILQGIEVKTDQFFARIGEMHGFSLVGSHRVRKKRVGSSIVNSPVRAATTKKRIQLYETAIELRAPA